MKFVFEFEFLKRWMLLTPGFCIDIFWTDYIYVVELWIQIIACIRESSDRAELTLEYSVGCRPECRYLKHLKVP